MLMRKDTCPIDYRMCDQTVTVYHKDGDTVTRTVHANAYLDYRKTRNVDKTGSREANSFLLVIPGPVQAVHVGDKVLHGTGREISAGEWAQFIPTKVPGLLVVQSVDPKHWNGRLVHTEAGG